MYSTAAMPAMGASRMPPRIVMTARKAVFTGVSSVDDHDIAKVFQDCRNRTMGILSTSVALARISGDLAVCKQQTPTMLTSLVSIDFEPHG